MVVTDFSSYSLRAFRTLNMAYIYIYIVGANVICFVMQVKSSKAQNKIKEE